MIARGNQNPESVVREIRRKTRRKYSTEEKIRIVLEGLKGKVSITELCRREGIISNPYYRRSKDFLEAGKKRLSGDTALEANSSEVTDLRRENDQLKQLVAEYYVLNCRTLCSTYRKPFDILAKGSSRILWRGGPHSPQTFVSFVFPVRTRYSVSSGTRWKMLY